MFGAEDHSSESIYFFDPEQNPGWDDGAHRGARRVDRMEQGAEHWRRGARKLH
jgi:hypothetical protein